MHSPLLNCYIFICKLIICISIFLSLNSHHWIRDIDGSKHIGPQFACYDYGHLCYERDRIKRGIWFFYIIAFINVLFESLNILFLCRQTRSRINLILEELGILTTIIFLLPGTLISAVGFIVTDSKVGEILDWSFFIFFLSVILSVIDLICSLVRVVSYCRDNSFRSNKIIYSSNNNRETVHIQS